MNYWDTKYYYYPFSTMFEVSTKAMFKILLSLFAFSWAISTLVLVGEDKNRSFCGPHIWNYALGWFIIYLLYGIIYLMTVTYNFFTKANLSLLHILKRQFYVNLFIQLFNLAIFLWGFSVVVGDNCYSTIGLKQIALGDFVLTVIHIAVQMAYTWDEFNEGMKFLVEDSARCFRRTFQGESNPYPQAVTSTSTSSDIQVSATSDVKVSSNPKSQPKSTASKLDDTVMGGEFV